jgi:uncharacterized protein YrzB (UPF0473 family)
MVKKKVIKVLFFLKMKNLLVMGILIYFNNINSEEKLYSRVVKVDNSEKVKNYVYRVISQKKYKKLLTLREIYKFSDIE